MPIRLSGMVSVIAYFVLYFLFKKNKERFVGYLENAAAAYSAY